MSPHIFHVYGPLWINWYGIMIGIGLLCFSFLFLNHPMRKSIISTENFTDILGWAILVGIAGGRILFIAENASDFQGNWIEIFYPWIGGFSILGTIIAELIFFSFFLYKKNIPFFSFTDLCALYAPLFQAIARLGCLGVGCCFGSTTSATNPLAIMYENSESLAPLNIYLHPAQLYSSGASFIVFLIIRYGLSFSFKKAGQITFLYLCLESLARFITDFWRGDRVFIVTQPYLLSFAQLVALGLSFFAFLSFLFITFKKKQ